KPQIVLLIGAVLAMLLVNQEVGAQSGKPVSCLEQIRNANRGHRGSTVEPACLRLGPVAIGMSHAEVEQVMGPADIEVAAPASCTNAVYMWPRDLNNRLAARPARGLEDVSVDTIRLIYQQD